MPSGFGARPWFPKLAILVAIVVTVSAAALIHYRWYNARSPSSYLTPFIPPESRTALAGAEVVINHDGAEIARVRLNEANAFSAPVLVEADVVYTMTVRLGDQVLMRDRPLAVPYRRGINVPITTRPAMDR